MQKRYENSDNNNNMNGNGIMSVDGPITTVPNLHSNGNNNINGIVTSPGKGVKMISHETIFFSKDTKIGKNVSIDPYVLIGKEVNISGTKEEVIEYLSTIDAEATKMWLIKARGGL